MKSTKINITYEDIRNVLIHDMRNHFSRTIPIHDVYSHYMDFNGGGCTNLSANMLLPIFKNAYSRDPELNEYSKLIEIASQKEKSIQTVSENLKNLWGVIKVARHMHFIKNTISFAQT